MREGAFREYASTTRRELAGLGKKLYDAIDAGRRSSAPSPRRYLEDPELAGDDEPSIDEARTPFARELGDAWVEVEPGIYEHAPSPPAPRKS